MPILVQSALLGFGRRIAVARKARGFSQAELASLSNVGLSTIVAIESGQTGVAIGNVGKVLDALGLLEQLDSMADPALDPFVVDAGLRSLTPQSRVRIPGDNDGG